MKTTMSEFIMLNKKANELLKAIYKIIEKERENKKG